MYDVISVVGAASDVVAPYFGAIFDVGIVSDGIVESGWKNCVASDAREVFDVGVAFDLVEVSLVGVVFSDVMISDFGTLVGVGVVSDVIVVSDGVVVSLPGVVLNDVVCDDGVEFDTAGVSIADFVLDDGEVLGVVCAVAEVSSRGVVFVSNIVLLGCSVVNLTVVVSSNADVVYDVESGFDVISETDEVSCMETRFSVYG